MRRFFILLFVISLLATGAAVYWRSYHPEASVPVAQSTQPSAPQAGGGGASDGTAPSAQSASEFVKEPSPRQNMALTISIVSSIISALAAIVQTWLTARASRHF